MGFVGTRETVARLVAERQAAGERAVCTNGVFDLLHLGHVTYLQRARELGDFLVIGVNSDESVRRIKGPRRPLIPEAERAATLAALGCVEYIVVFGERTAESLIGELRPDIYVKGADYAHAEGAAQQDYLIEPAELRALLRGDASARPALAGLAARLPEARVVADYGGRVALLSYLPGHSTSDLIERIIRRYAPEGE